MTEEEKIRQVLYEFEDAGLISKDMKRIKGCFAEQIIGIGIGEQGFVKSVQDVCRTFEMGQKEEDKAFYSLVYDRVEIIVMNQLFAVLCAEITVLSKRNEQDSSTSKSKLLQSISLVKEKEKWKICGLHASTPVITEESLDAYPLKFAESSLKSLREKIGEEAYLAEEQYRQAVLADTIAFYIIDFSTDIFEKCQLNCDWCVYTQPGTPYEEFLLEQVPMYLPEEDRLLFLQSFSKDNVRQAFRNDKKELSCEYRMKRQDGTYLWVISIVRLITDVVTGHQKGIMYVKNIDQSKRNEILMRNRVTYDEMTGIYQKSMMNRFVSEQLEHTGGIFIMLDIDNFKTINDTYGHPVGDWVLIAIADELKSVCGDTALLGRMGGDEFAVFLPDAELTDSIKGLLAEILHGIRQIRLPEDCSVIMTCSIGAIHCERGSTFEEIYKKADSALYISKKHGKDRISHL